MLSKVKMGVGAIVLISLASCQTTKEDESILGGIGGAIIGGVTGNQVGSGSGRVIATIAGTAVGAWLGTKFVELLNNQDQATLANSTHEAASSGRPQEWTNPNTGVSGVTKVKKTTKKEKYSQIRVLKDRVKETPPMVFVNKTFVVVKNSNVRGGPSTDYVVVDSMKVGDKTTVLGKVDGKDWYLISKNGVGTGYVYAPLLKEAPEAPQTPDTPKNEPLPPADDVVEVTIASGQTCRIITQEVTLDDGRVEEDEVTVCNGPNGWVVA